jgi:hypothetical protein
MGRAGEMVCDGAKMIKCGDMFEAADTQPCQNEARCRAGLEAGKCGACDPGIVMCMESDLYECSMAGEMVMTEHCDSPALCDDVGKKCDPAACELDEHKCDGGELLRCMDDRTAFESKTSCPMELCDEAGKKCNVCMPNSKMCVGSKLEVCNADGSGKQDMDCPMDKPMCITDKCVQCMSNNDCMAPSDCQTTMCMEGTCTPPQSKAAGTACSSNGGKVCGLAGSCVACNLDSDCSASERCSVVFGCIQRAAMTVVQLLPGVFSVQVNAGYGLAVDSQSGADAVTISSGLFRSAMAPQVVGMTVVQPASGSPQTVSVTGPRGGGTFGLGCGWDMFTDTTATLKFAEPGMDVDGNVTGGTCNISVSVKASGN